MIKRLEPQRSYLQAESKENNEDELLSEDDARSALDGVVDPFFSEPLLPERPSPSSAKSKPTPKPSRAQSSFSSWLEDSEASDEDSDDREYDPEDFSSGEDDSDDVDVMDEAEDDGDVEMM